MTDGFVRKNFQNDISQRVSLFFAFTGFKDSFECFLGTEHGYNPYIAFLKSVNADKIDRHSQVWQTEYHNYVENPYKILRGAVADGFRRYEIVNHKKYNFHYENDLIMALLPFCLNNAAPCISFRDDSIKTIVSYKGGKYIFDYDFDCPDTVFITTFKNIENRRKMFVKECTITDIYMILDSF